MTGKPAEAEARFKRQLEEARKVGRSVSQICQNTNV